MRAASIHCIAAALLLTAAAVQGQEADPAQDVLASRGDGVVTQMAFDARVARIPEEHRGATIRDRNRLRDVLNALLLRAQLAAEARLAGFDQDEFVKARMRLAADEELAVAWLHHYAESQPEADYEALAREYYDLHTDEFMTEPLIDVSHILISTAERSEEEARALAGAVLAEVRSDPERFAELVATHSEDPSAASNKGAFTRVGKGMMVRPFEEAAFALQEGQVSDLVRTQYGFHVIRLDRIHEPTRQTFEEVRGRLVDAQRSKHLERIRSNHLSELTSLDVNMTEEALEAMVARQFRMEAKAESDGVPESE